MKTPLSLFPGLAALLAFTASTAAGERSITEFTRQDNKKLGWQVVNDGVMGGLSKGNAKFTRSNILQFTGTLSLENNGGFSSLRTRDIKLNLGNYDGLEIRVKGDGRTYGVRIGSDARYRGMEVSFGAEFPAKKGKYTTVRVPFDKLVGGSRGMTINKAVFNPEKIQRLGLIIADKKTGPFDLEVVWIRAYSDKKGKGAKPQSLIKTALADGRFNTLAKALTEADLVEALQGDGPFTVFAPTDKAFAALPGDTVATLLKPENRAQLQAVLKYHVVAGSIPLADALKAGEAKTLQGDSLAITFAEGRVRINESPLLNADIQCTNGVIHVVEAVILPPSKPEPEATTDILGLAKSAKVFSTLLAAVDAVGLTETLSGDGPFTVFAPTDDAFAKLPKGTVASLLKPENKSKLQAILKYHVVSGDVDLSGALKAGRAPTLQGESVSIGFANGKVNVNNATLLTADLRASNGVIHVIDSVLLPPEPKNDILAVAKNAGQFKTLLTAVEAAGLTSVLTGKDPVTVLAPTDAAFKALPKGTIKHLLDPAHKDRLIKLLSLHVVKGSVTAGTALNAGNAKSVANQDLRFEISNGTFKVNGVTILKTDIKCDNGIIHVIDAVIIPNKQKTVGTNPAKTTRHSSLQSWQYDAP